MEYVQMTLDNWLALKGQLEEELRGAAAGFVRIGYLLRKIDETEGYKNDGSKSLSEWAKDNYGLSATAVSRFMAINKRYSVEGYSDQLKLEYAQYGSAKLSEMLALPDADLEMVSPEMKREDIREIKKFNKEMEEEAKNPHPEEEQDIEVTDEAAPAAGFAEPVPQKGYEWILEFFRLNGDMMNELYSSAAYKNSDYDAMKEIVNPSGARTFRHKVTMVSMLDSKIMIKTFGQMPGMMSWERFFIAAEAMLGHERINGEATYRNVFGQDPDPAIEEMPKKGQEKKEKPKKDPVKELQKAMKPEKAIAPAQKSEPDIVENSEKQDSAIAEHETEQVEIDEIMPAPTGPDPMRDVKDRFLAEINSLKILLDCENFSGMKQTIERLEQLRVKMATMKFAQE